MAYEYRLLLGVNIQRELNGGSLSSQLDTHERLEAYRRFMNARERTWRTFGEPELYYTEIAFVTGKRLERGDLEGELDPVEILDFEERWIVGKELKLSLKQSKN